MNKITIDEWRGLYSESWKGVIVDDAFAHPAKFSRALIRKIYDHVIAEGWASKGESVVDPFGGVALGGFDAMQHGLNWIGVELEIKFHELAAGSDCGGFTKADWRRLHLRFGRLNYTREFHWCPECLAAAGKIGTNRQIPSRDPHRFRGNIALWNERFSRMPNWGTARLLQGDSRNLCDELREASCSVSSPPYGCDSLHRAVNAGREEALPAADRMGKSAWGGGYGNSEGQLSSLPATTEGHSLAIASPPYTNETVNDRNGIDLSLVKKPGGHNSQSRTMAGYGEASGQLGAMKEGDHSIVISSPPYIDSINSRQDGEKCSNRLRRAGYDEAFIRAHVTNPASQLAVDQRYGATDGQLGAMPEGQLCVTSPPFESSLSSGRLSEEQLREMAQRGHKPSASGQSAEYGKTNGNLGNMRGGFEAAISSPPYEGSLDHAPGNKNWDTSGKYCAQIQTSTEGYGVSANNVGLTSGETFWSASRLILEQLHQVLAPNAHAVFVVKSFVRNKKIVDFPAQWAQLCEAVGFKLLHDHHALLTEEHGRQDTLTGEGDRPQRTVQRKSFFRRLAEQKGSPRIDYENVLCFKKI